jgi:hypothetical protein
MALRRPGTATHREPSAPSAPSTKSRTSIGGNARDRCCSARWYVSVFTELGTSVNTSTPAFRSS